MQGGAMQRKSKKSEARVAHGESPNVPRFAKSHLYGENRYKNRYKTVTKLKRSKWTPKMNYKLVWVAHMQIWAKNKFQFFFGCDT